MDLRSWPIVSSLEPEFVKQIHMVMVYNVEKNGSNALILTKDKMVYVLQDNYDCDEGEFSMIYPKKIETLCTKKIKSFAFGNDRNLLTLTEGGEVYILGSDKYFQELIFFKNMNVELPTLIEIPSLDDNLSLNRVVDIACGNLHFVILTEIGQVYTWKESFKRDRNNMVLRDTTPRKFDALARKKVVYISCGLTFTIVVIDNGEVYGWGDNDIGQLGVGDKRGRQMPCQLNLLKGIVIVKVACGDTHTLALTDEGNLYAWGENESGQLGNNCLKHSNEPVLVAHKMGKVFDIAALYERSSAMDKRGRVYVWGRCHEQKIMTPIVTPFSDMHRALACYGFTNIMHKPLILKADDELQLDILKILRIAFDDPVCFAFYVVSAEHIQNFYYINFFIIIYEYIFYNYMFYFYIYSVLYVYSIIIMSTFIAFLHKTSLLLQVLQVRTSDANLCPLANNKESLLAEHINSVIHQYETDWRNTLEFLKETVFKKKFILHGKKRYQTKRSVSYMCSDLRSWPIVSFLEPRFVSQIHMVMAFSNYLFSSLILQTHFGSIVHLYTRTSYCVGRVLNNLHIDAGQVFIITRDKMVYALGTNDDGRLGTGDTLPTLYPKKVEALCMKDIKKFACGECHILALTEQGEIYSWGNNRFGQVGNGSDDEHVMLPTHLNILPMKCDLHLNKVVDIACGYNHSIALTAFGEVYTWGLHHIEEFEEYIDVENESVLSSPTPMRLDSLHGKKVVYIACGATFTIVIMDNGNVYSWGSNKYGQLGVGDERDRQMPCQLNSLKGIVIVKVACGYAHTLALTDEGNLYTWGLNTNGQLGIGNGTNSSKPVMVKHKMGRVFDIAADHCKQISIAVNKEGRVYIWGLCRKNSITSPIATPCLNVHTAFASYTSPAVMHEPLILNANEELEILKDLKIAFDNPLTSDLTIHVENKCIHVHKAVLKFRSSYFRRMFQHIWSENNQSVIQHDQYSYKVYKAFLNYLYTDVIELPWEQTVELFILANTYCEDSLEKRCTEMLKHEITVSNVAYLYSIATKYNNKVFKQCRC
ncbi:RCC1 and BTB domain-containing protein 1 [Cyphomyrmex costatus]|uniref:RCC1 and BTB domain-containing protein 1 n=1 Tax=Cyphomyrmex costatus TaxID=456900 RepID=A0A151IL49_9HYME|nr:RCC1 and BTB domain-containing protein 1 [Cyphomyrmex costatus]